MAIEDLFKIVKERFVAEQPAVPASQEGDVEIPQDLLFKCPRCGAFTILRAMRPCSESPDGQNGANCDKGLSE